MNLKREGFGITHVEFLHHISLKVRGGEKGGEGLQICEKFPVFRVNIQLFTVSLQHTIISFLLRAFSMTRVGTFGLT